MNLYGIVVNTGKYDDMVFAVAAESVEEAIQKVKDKWFNVYGTNVPKEYPIYAEFSGSLETIPYWYRSND